MNFTAETDDLTHQLIVRQKAMRFETLPPDVVELARQ